MPYLTSPIDGARLYYADYHPAPTPSTTSTSSNKNAAETQPFLTATPLASASASPSSATSNRTPPKNFTLLFIHGWPMSSEMYTPFLLELSQTYGIRCVAPDRRGFGKSEWSGSLGQGRGDVTYETFARDTVAVVRDAGIGVGMEGEWAIVAASMGCAESVLVEGLLEGEVREKFKGFVWMGPSMPYPLQSEMNPTAPPRELWNAILQGLRDDRVGFVKVAIHGVFGTRPVEEGGLGLGLPPSKIEYFEHIVRQADALALERCPMIITGHDSSEELKKLDRKVLVLHGDSDQSMPASASADLIMKLMPDGLCEVKIYEKAAHGMYLTHAGQVMDDNIGLHCRCDGSLREGRKVPRREYEGNGCRCYIDNSLGTLTIH